MLYVVLIPTTAWIALLLGIWLALTVRLVGLWEIGDGVRSALIGLLAVQGLAAAATAIATEAYPISPFACWGGIIGVWVSAALTVLAAIALSVLLRRWPRNEAGGRRRWVSTLILWLAYSGLAVLAHLRSAVLCTV